MNAQYCGALQRLSSSHFDIRRIVFVASVERLGPAQAPAKLEPSKPDEVQPAYLPIVGHAGDEFGHGEK